jgi:HUS1 checkpoint protein
MSLSSEALLSALKSCQPSTTTNSSFETEEVVVKLAKKSDQAVLSFEISGATNVGRAVQVTHDVKIEVLRPTDVEKLREPMCPEPDVRMPFVSAVSALLNYSLVDPYFAATIAETPYDCG